MGQGTVDFPSKRMLAQLDKLRGCHNCKDKKNCDRYAFVSDATEAIIEEKGLEESFLGQILARNLSWAIADEAILSGTVAEAEDELYYEGEGEPNPLFYVLESLRDHIRELAKIMLEMHKGGE